MPGPSLRRRLREGLVLLVGVLCLSVGPVASSRPGAVATIASSPPLSLPLAPLARPRLPQVLPDPPSSWVPRRWLPGHLLVGYYGNPFSPAMGALGQGTPAAMVARLRRQAAAYQRLTAVPVQPALDLIATVAQASPQADGSYRLRMPASLIRREIALAASQRMPLFLDVQVGRSTVPAEVGALARYLALPYVELALDPEFDLPPGGRPGREIGSMSAADVNWAIDDLAAIVRRDRLPDKVLVVHQFTQGMLPGWRDIRTRSGVQLVLDMDGFGSPQTKSAFYRLFVGRQPIPGGFGGIKLFYTQDNPLLSPAQVLALLPAPSLVLYQ